MRFFRKALIPSVLTFLLCGCAQEKPAGNVGSSAANANQPAPANATATRGKPVNENAAGTNATGTGSILVASGPPGARILLIPIDEGGASVPQSRGVTPATITGLSPGKYAVGLEMPGYKSFQKEVVVKANSTETVKAKLRK